MENYRVLQRLGKGAQGSVYLVESKMDKGSYVLKKVECNDEGEANKAFKEAMALQELKHPFICGYKEFFVTWDKEESAMFVCIVMNFYEMGDLAKVIKTKRQKQEPIEEMIIKKWTGQMIEGLVFVHNKQVIHRDLKPSNIFMTKQLNITIGDFGVATVMGDARTRTRTTVGSMNWMAPEVMDRPYDERSDVWSLGCIILEMATCSTMDTVQISSSLFEIKQNPQCLEDALVDVGKAGYSANLCQLIRTMLRRNFQQRPTMTELVVYPYVQECLSLNPETTLVKKKTSSSAVTDPLPKNQGIPAVIAYMSKNSDNEEAQKQSLEYLDELSQLPGNSFTDNVKKQVVKAMSDHIAEINIQIHGCNILSNILGSVGDGDILYSKQIMQPILLAMRSHPSSSDLQTVACSVIMALSADECAADVIGEIGGIQDILAAMRQFPDNATICANCCGALWSLAVNETNTSIVTKEQGLGDVCKAMEQHSKVPEVVETACSAIWSLSLEDDNIEMLSDIAISLIVEALQTHMKDARVIKNAFMALASIITCDEVCAFRVIVPGSDMLGLRTMLDAFKKHEDNADIAENFCTVIAELSEYDDVAKEIKSPAFKLPEVFAKIRDNYKSNDEIVSAISTIQKKLGFKANQPSKPAQKSKQKK
ncbi:serine/threonine kinase-like domain-containing protein STKLD1 [Styela clava]|uniref:serine/threonine kinase-like domain-containing protein STKLD1 n=1 Tax=Styela clava TaxID=7725 RepID=UPI00193A4684|nr:serine/threonine kinase-like domain-containing protein STKLD1 [Styela clava]